MMDPALSGNVIIMRGLPGSGKSTEAKRIKALTETAGGTCVIVSADHYFERTGTYVFDPKKLGKAHEACFDAFLTALSVGIDTVIVDNTHTQIWELKDYVRIGRIGKRDVQVIEFIPKDEAELEQWHARCIHGVPLDKMRAMWKRFERDPDFTHPIVAL